MKRLSWSPGELGSKEQTGFLYFITYLSIIQNFCLLYYKVSVLIVSECFKVSVLIVSECFVQTVGHLIH